MVVLMLTIPLDAKLLIYEDSNLSDYGKVIPTRKFIKTSFLWTWFSIRSKNFFFVGQLMLVLKFIKSNLWYGNWKLLYIFSFANQLKTLLDETFICNFTAFSLVLRRWKNHLNRYLQWGRGGNYLCSNKSWFF